MKISILLKMEESFLLEVLCPMLIIPYWFICYSIFRIRRHWNDGKEKNFFSNSKILFIKYFLCVVMVLVTVAQVILSVFKTNDTGEAKSIKIVLFSSFVVSWIMSVWMLRIETMLRLDMKWNGHRMYWPVNFVIYVILIILEILDKNIGFIEFLSFKLVVDLIGVRVLGC